MLGLAKVGTTPAICIRTRTIRITATHNKNKTYRLTHNKNNTAEAQLTDSFGEVLSLGLAPRLGREQQKLHVKQTLN
ncbi:hypothetical protein PLUA15_120025 [Pseudomonas lundensis]|uniref:Transposase n=1 Tax=Pseudomonas lundensis TaxID=86185 RepID=A0AAX2H294_9PSED|nr:hypothetical protein PLUA15_120025 [Pseudomonas lundensis]